MLDCGSEITLIALETVEKLKLKITESPLKNLTQACNAKADVLGLTWLTVHFYTDEGFTNPEILRAYVVKNSPTTHLVGNDFLCRFPSFPAALD